MYKIGMNINAVRLGKPLVNNSRCFSYSHRRNFLGNLFGRKTLKDREEIIKKQDDFEIDPNAKIVILNEENSPDKKPFNLEEDMPGFEIAQWKSKFVRNRDIEHSYTPEKLQEIINKTYEDMTGAQLTQDYNSVYLKDLDFRFKFSKQLQLNLGFNINDYVLTNAHTLNYLYESLCGTISKRWTSERNPNAIVLRPEDFSSPNVYLNEELNESQKQKLYNDLLEKARKESFVESAE